MKIRMILSAFILAGLLSGCGLRGELDPPKGTPKETPDNPFILDKVI